MTPSSLVLLLLIAPFLGMPIPLLPIQILWINLIADGLLALALSFEPAERQVVDEVARVDHAARDAIDLRYHVANRGEFTFVEFTAKSIANNELSTVY